MLERNRVHQRLAHRSAFTLIELLVVVAIIALLISILLPGLQAAREQTRSLKCLANLRSMGQAILTYTMGERGKMPGPLHPPIYRRTGEELDDMDGTVDGAPDCGGDCFDPMPPDTQRPWFLLSRLAPMMMNGSEPFYELVDEVATCPTAKKVKDDTQFCPTVCVSTNPQWSRPYNYLINSWINTKPSFYFGWTNIGVTWEGWTYQYSLNPDNPSYQPPKGIDEIPRQSEEWIIGDAWWQFKKTFIKPGQFEETMLGTWQTNGGDSRNPLPNVPYHAGGKGTNLLYVDGHANQFKGIDEWARQFPINRADP